MFETFDVEVCISQEAHEPRKYAEELLRRCELDKPPSDVSVKYFSRAIVVDLRFLARDAGAALSDGLRTVLVLARNAGLSPPTVVTVTVDRPRTLALVPGSES